MAIPDDAEVYPGYTQSALDRAYSQRDWADNVEVILARWTAIAPAIRTSAQTCREFRYGPADCETIDIYMPAAASGPVHFHIHGGAWRAQTKEDCAFLAPMMMAANTIFAVPEFGKLPQARMPEVFEQIVRALVWTYERQIRSGRSQKIFVSGHSSGAHMAALLAAYDWSSVGVDKNVFLGFLCISGPYDLEPVLISSRRDYIDLTAQEALQLSPIRHAKAMCMPLHLLYGTHESPIFIEHSRAFAAALEGQGKLAECVEIAETNHFEIIDRMADATTDVGKYLLRLLGEPDVARNEAREAVA